MHKGNDEPRQASKSQQDGEEDNWHPDEHDYTSITNHFTWTVKDLF